MGFKKVRPRKKVCEFCKRKVDSIDYKDVELLSKYIAPTGKILPRYVTGNCAKHQRLVAKAIKNAREIGLLPYVAD